MGGIYGCGCKEVSRFPHTTYPYSSCICSFLQHPYFLFIKKKCFPFSFQYIFVIYVIFFFTQYKHTYGRLRMGVPRKPYEGLHITKKHMQTNTSYPVMDISRMPSRDGV